MDIHKIRGEDHYRCREVKAERDMLKAKLDDLRARLAAAEADACNSPAIAAIEYALSQDDSETFLRLWFMGDFEALRAEWDDVPDAVFIGADPLFEPNAIDAARGGE